MSCAHFLTGLFGMFLPLSFECSLYILDTSSLLDMWSENIFSQSVVCLFILIGSFPEQMFLILVQVQCVNFSIYGLCP